MLFTEECKDILPNAVTPLENLTSMNVRRKGKPLHAAVNSQRYKETSLIDIGSMSKDHILANQQEVSVEAKSMRTIFKVHDVNTEKTQQGNAIVQEQLKLRSANKIHEENRNLGRNHFATLKPPSCYLTPFRKAVSNRLSNLQMLQKTKVHRWNSLIQNNKNTSDKKETVVGILKQFCSECTINGVHYLDHKHRRKILAAFLTLVICYCLYQCKLNIDKYLQYELSITVMEDTVSATDFPAITICPMTFIRRSTFGKLAYYDFGLSDFYSYSTNEGERATLRIENMKTCSINTTVPFEERLLLFHNFVDSFSSISSILSNKYIMLYQDFLLKCDWNNKDIDCEDAFMNHVTDTGVCFTFNPGENFAQLLNETKAGYGINLGKYKEDYFKTQQGQSGLKLHMTVKQEEYCGNDNLKHGAGFYFQVHGLNRSPQFILNPSTYLNPGYDIEVNIAKKVYIRNTEHLGNCTKFVKLYMTPNVTFYAQEHCIMLQCVTEYILKTCKCYPANIEMFKDSLKSRAKDFNLIESDVKLCYASGLRCMKMWLFNNLSSSSMNVLCPYCKQPCHETKYTVTTTSLLLSQRNFKIPEFRNVSFERLRKNYIVVKFNLRTFNVEKIIEDQMFTMRDLFIYMGNNIGLYLGMSFITFFEILYFIIEIFICLCKL